jgi:dUTP pyrophosphatase
LWDCGVYAGDFDGDCDGVAAYAWGIGRGYRGEVRVVLTNLNPVAVEVAVGDRIAQLRIVERIEASFEDVAELVDAPRGAAGFGSTGQ